MMNKTQQTKADFNVWTEIWISNVGEMKPMFWINCSKMRHVSRLARPNCRYTSWHVTPTSETF